MIPARALRRDARALRNHGLISTKRKNKGSAGACSRKFVAHKCLPQISCDQYHLHSASFLLEKLFKLSLSTYVTCRYCTLERDIIILLIVF